MKLRFLLFALGKDGQLLEKKNLRSSYFYVCGQDSSQEILYIEMYVATRCHAHSGSESLPSLREVKVKEVK